MKAERAIPKQEFVPVIVTLESQEEVDSLYAVVNNSVTTSILPALQGWWNKLEPYRSSKYQKLWDKFNKALN